MLALTMVPRRSDMDSASTDGTKLSRPELELRKCLGNDTEELLLKSYSCAWQKEILVQGHLHITAHHFCFYSNILGWETKMILKCSDVIGIKKDRTAMVIPNAIMITTQEKKYGFSTFAHRNRAIKVLHMIWQNALLDQPLSQEQLVVKVKLLKNKSKSVEGSPSDTPGHCRKPHKQFSLRVPFSRTTDSDSSGSESPILTSNTTPSTSPLHTPSSTTAPPLLPNGGAPVVTTTTNIASGNNAHLSHTHQTGGVKVTGHNYQNSFSSTITDVTDGNDSQVELDSEQSDTNNTLRSMVADLSSNNSSETGSYEGADNMEEPLARKVRSPSIVGLASEVMDTSQVGSGSDRWEEGRGEGQGTVEQEEGERGGKRTEKENVREVGSAQELILRHILHNVHNPTQLSLWRLKSGLQEWITPSNFINLLIIISIFLLLISTVSMVCKLSYINPSLHPLLAWQPWCKLCSECNMSKFPQSSMVTVEEKREEDARGGGEGGGGGGGGGGGLLTSELFEELVRQHANDPYTDSSSASETARKMFEDVESNDGSLNPSPS